MKFKFICVMHDIELLGKPIWVKDVEPTYGDEAFFAWLPDTSEMHCPKGVGCQTTWEILLANK